MHQPKKKSHNKVYRVLYILVLFLIVSSTTHAETTSFWLELKHVWYDIFTPADYYLPIVNSDLDISREGESKTIELTHKYDRAYISGLILKGFGYGDDFFESKTKRYKTTLHLEISFYVDDTLLLKKSVQNDDYSPFLATYGGGMHLFYYKCPNELPLNKKIICVVKVTKPDKHLQDTYGPVKFFIAKMSDK